MNLKQFFLQMKCRRKRNASATQVTLPVTFSGVRSPLAATLYSWPFPHATIDDFFSAERTETLRLYFNNMLQHGKFTHHTKYDLWATFANKSDNAEIRDVFRSHEFKDMVARLFNIQLSPYVTTALHNNKPRNTDKYVHNDSITALFREQSGLDVFGPELEGSGLPQTINETAPPVIPQGFLKKMRIATAIYYLSPDWKPGMGGGTGIFYRHEGRDIECGESEPRYNRVLLFHNSPTALHNYKACKLPDRNSVISWYHN